jgi:hypothetical protein
MQKQFGSDLYTRIATPISQACQSIVKNINYTMVYTHFEISRMILEDEQQGNAKAAYEAKTLKELSRKLSANFGKGFSERNLEQIRYFYLVYSKRQISQTLSAKSTGPKKSRTLFDQFNLSWSHYLKPMRIDNENDRKFYEIECINNGEVIKP